MSEPEKSPGPAAKPDHFDIAILGTRLGGILLAGILARHGVRVVILDDDPHPRYQSGEATIPYTSMILELIADRYDMPEIRNIARSGLIARHVMPSSGVKRNLGFLYHEKGKTQDPTRILQFNVPSEHGENHLFRQDIDAYLLHAAIRRGAVYRPWSRNGAMEVGRNGATIQDGYGEALSADYVVDDCGRSSPLAAKFGLRVEPGNRRARSVTFTTHMVDVTPYDHCVHHRLPGRWHDGTLHHVFDGGWIGIIPFDNHKNSTNPLCSVVISVTDPAEAARSGDDLLAGLIDRFPSLKPHLGGARRVREWDVEAPAQYSCKDALGGRYLLFDESAGGNDLLFSRKLSNTVELVHALGHRLIAAARTGDYQKKELRDFGRIQEGVQLLADRIAAGAQIAMRHPDLWNAFARVWLMQSIACTVTTRKVHDAFVKSRDQTVLESLDRPVEDGFWMPVYEGYKRLLDQTLDSLSAVDDGRLPPVTAAQRVFDALAAVTSLPPIFDFADPKARIYHLTPARKLKALWWSLTQAPDGVGRLIFYRSFRKLASGPVAQALDDQPLSRKGL